MIHAHSLGHAENQGPAGELAPGAPLPLTIGSIGRDVLAADDYQSRLRARFADTVEPFPGQHVLFAAVNELKNTTVPAEEIATEYRAIASGAARPLNVYGKYMLQTHYHNVGRPSTISLYISPIYPENEQLIEEQNQLREVLRLPSLHPVIKVPFGLVKADMPAKEQKALRDHLRHSSLVRARLGAVGVGETWHPGPRS